MTFTRRIGLATLIALVIGSSASLARAGDLDWNPKRTWLFAVGILEWEDAEMWASFPNAVPNRSDARLVEFFRKAGVPDEQIVYLQDKHATKAKIVAAFKDLLDKTAEGDTLIFYFAGHGYRDVTSGRTHFANYDSHDDASSWAVDSIFNQIERRFNGDRVLLLADCCHSGDLCEQVRRRSSDELAMAAVASVDSRGNSTGRWTFTNAILAGLSGDPVIDSDHDGSIELDELATNAELDMAFDEGQKGSFCMGEGFDPRFVVAKTSDEAMTPRAGERLEALSEGEWYKAQILKTRGNEAFIHYVEYNDSYDEWVTPDRLRPYRPLKLAEGTKVDARWESEWYPATVVKSWYGLHRVRYDGYEEKWDEWVGPHKIRIRGK